MKGKKNFLDNDSNQKKTESEIATELQACLSSQGSLKLASIDEKPSANSCNLNWIGLITKNKHSRWPGTMSLNSIPRVLIPFFIRGSS